MQDDFSKTLYFLDGKLRGRHPGRYRKDDIVKNSSPIPTPPKSISM